ncbi:MAG: mucoidy inhibitor MuiA family protein [Myxococcaceae bacterium]
MNALIMLLLLASADRVEEVTVYADRAQVKRVAQLTDCSRQQVVTFANLPASADLHSLRANVSGGALEGLRSELEPRRTQFSKELAQLEEEERKLAQERAGALDARKRAQSSNLVTQSYQRLASARVGREMADRADPKSWGVAFEALLNARLKAADAQMDATQRLRILDERRAELTDRRRQLESGAGRQQGLAEVLVGCRDGQKPRVELTYLVGGASWEPQYEARAREKHSEVELAVFGTVKQSTGESWNRARLILSTAIPSQNATPPRVTPLRVYAHEREETKRLLVRRDEYMEQTHAGSSDGAQPSGEGLSVQAQGLSVQLTAAELVDIPGDGNAVRVLVARQQLKSKLGYRTVPKLSPYVYRVAELTNTVPFPLLPGVVEVYRDGGFVARYPLERVPEGGYFQLGFGAAESLRVTRTVLQELKKDVGLFGGKRRFHYAYQFELASYEAKPVEVELAEHVPISEMEDVTVSLAAQTSATAKLSPSDGIVTWRRTLQPRDTLKLQLAYDVDVPSSYESGGL